LIKHLMLAVFAITGSVEASDLTKKQTADWIVKKFEEGKITPILTTGRHATADTSRPTFEFSPTNSCRMHVKFEGIEFRLNSKISRRTIGRHHVELAEFYLDLGRLEYPTFDSLYKSHFDGILRCDTQNYTKDCITNRFTGYYPERKNSRIFSRYHYRDRGKGVASVLDYNLRLNFDYEPSRYQGKFMKALTHLITLCRPAVEDEPF